VNKRRVAVVGVGHLGKIHARLLGQLPPVELVGVVDAIAETRSQVAADLQTTAYADHRQLLGKIDAAVVATPTRDHYAVASELLAAGVHVFVEKPIALNVADADDLIATAEANRCVLQVGHVERFNPALTAAAPQIREPKYIDAVRATGYSCRSTDIGVVLDLMIHDIDIVLSLVRDDVVDVQSLGAAVFGPNEDWAQARLTFAHGCVANLTASRVSDLPQRSLHVVSADGFTRVDLAAKTASVVRTSRAVRCGEVDVHELSPAQKTHLKDNLFTDYLPLEQLAISDCNAIAAEHQDFLQAIAAHSEVRVSGRDGRRALDVAERILAEIAAHRWDSAGASGPRYEPAVPTLRGPHWNRLPNSLHTPRRIAG
jgi:predicted dehydrogenase